MQPNNLSLG
jgi:hypothetical protein